MIRLITMALLAVLLAGCAGRPADHSALQARPQGPNVDSIANFPDIPLPTGKVASATFGMWEVVDYSGVDFSTNRLILTPLPGEYSWAIIDLGVQQPSMNIEKLYFRTAADWNGAQPAYAWVGLSDYTRGTWTWRYRDATGDPVDFSDAPAGTEFFQTAAPHHAYMAVISDHNPTDFGSMVATLALPEIHLYQPEIGIEAGLYNKFMFNPVLGGGDIVTYCPGTSESGGAVVRLDLGTDYTLNTQLFRLYQSTKCLESGIRFDMAYTNAGKLALLSARTEPVSVLRYTTESSTPGIFDIADTAVDSDFLPDPYSEPFIAMDLDNSDNPHIVFVDNNSTMRYVFRSAGAWVLTGGGYSIATRYLDIAARNADIIACYRDTTASQSALGISSHPISSTSNPWDPKYTLYYEPPKNGGNFNSMVLGPGNRIMIAQYISKNGVSTGGIPPGLGISYSASGVLGSSWTNMSADGGNDPISGEKYIAGPYCSLALLRDGTPVVAYMDETNNFLRMAIGMDVNGDAGFYHFPVDTDTEPVFLGRHTSISVQPGTGSEPDLIGVAYESYKGGKSTLRFALVVWHPE
jgi:hypothetical protein